MRNKRHAMTPNASRQERIRQRMKGKNERDANNPSQTDFIYGKSTVIELFLHIGSIRYAAILWQLSDYEVMRNIFIRECKCRP